MAVLVQPSAYRRERENTEYNVLLEGVLLIEQAKYVEIVKYDMLDTLNIPLTQWETIVLTALTHPDEVLAQETGMFTEEVTEEK